MIEGRRLAVVVPAYNEARWIGETIGSMPQFVDDIVVVDDASEDDTARLAAASDPRVHVASHPRNLGVGRAIATGYRLAWARGADVIAVMAGDGQMHPDDLAALCAPVVQGDAEYAKGDRLGHPELWSIMPRHRILGSLVLSALTRRAAGLEALSDSQCGYTVIDARVARALDLDALWSRYGYPGDLLGAVARAGFRVVDVPVRPIYAGQASGLRPWHALTIGFVLARVAWRRRRRAPR